MLQNRHTPDPHSFIGEGKAQEVRTLLESTGATLVVFDNDLSPSQIRALEELTDATVLDRSALILDIFAQRAKTAEGRLQVELAQYQYLLPKLSGMGTSMSRLGGGIGTRGPGETKLETDRRHIRERITRLQAELDEVRRVRATQRERRVKNSIPVVALVGYTNAGKSTLLNLVAGVYPVDSGSISIDGQDVTKLPEHKRAKFIGRVFQDPMMGTAATMQIEENLALAARRGKPRTLRPGITKADREFYKEQLRILDLGLEDRMTTKVGLLSGGQRQALTLLMATLQQPKLLLLDEHTAALDPKTAAKVLEATQRIVEKNHLTTMMITHNMRDAISYGNRLIMMYEGHVVVDVSGEEKKNLTVEQLLNLFSRASGSDEADDKLLLS